MSDTIGKIHIGINAEAVYTTPALDPFTQVALIGEDETFFWPDEDVGGRLLEVECPGATQEIARAVFELINGYSYQPIEFQRALYNPAMELGDAIESMAQIGGAYRYTIIFGDLTTADISAPADEDVAHEYTLPEGDSRYATYKALAAGTAEVNGACVMENSLDGSSIVDGSIYGGSGGPASEGWLSKIMAGTVSKTETDAVIKEDLRNAEIAIAHIDAWLDGNGASFGWLDTEGINIGYPNSRMSFLYGRPLYIRSDGVVYTTASPN